MEIIQVNKQFYRKLIESHGDLGILYFKKPIGHHTSSGRFIALVCSTPGAVRFQQTRWGSPSCCECVKISTPKGGGKWLCK